MLREGRFGNRGWRSATFQAAAGLLCRGGGLGTRRLLDRYPDYRPDMNEARSRQWLLWKTWTPRQKLAAVGRMTSSVLSLRAAGLALRHNTTDPERLRALRLAEVMKSQNL